MCVVDMTLRPLPEEKEEDLFIADGFTAAGNASALRMGGSAGFSVQV